MVICQLEAQVHMQVGNKNLEQIVVYNKCLNDGKFLQVNHKIGFLLGSTEERANSPFAGNETVPQRS